jgi:hypothetical protein
MTLKKSPFAPRPFTFCACLSILLQYGALTQVRVLFKREPKTENRLLCHHRSSIASDTTSDDRSYKTDIGLFVKLIQLHHAWSPTFRSLCTCLQQGCHPPSVNGDRERPEANSSRRTYFWSPKGSTSHPWRHRSCSCCPSRIDSTRYGRLCEFRGKTIVLKAS